MAAIEADGGSHVQEKHMGTEFELEFPTPRGKRKRKFRTAACKQEALFDIPYDDGKGRAASVRVCAVDDNVGAWPRFAGAVSREDA